MPLRVLSIVTLVFFAISGAHAQDFALRSDDRVVFYGDSITEQHLYTQWIESYVATRFTDRRISFWEAGIGGDKVTGGFGGDVEHRLERDVFSHNPTVITIMLGMNDGEYRAITPRILEDYREGYDHLLRAIHLRLPTARVFCIAPTPYDTFTRPAVHQVGEYNVTLAQFADIDQKLAKKYGFFFIDPQRSLTALLKKASASNLFAATLLIPDRIHPEFSVHLAIAAVVLESWNARSLVAKTVINMKTLADAGSRDTRITSLHKVGKEGISWEELDSALPLAAGRDNATLSWVCSLISFDQHLNQEILIVRGLRAGLYEVMIDKGVVGYFSSQDLQSGVDLSRRDSPMYRQAQEVQWLVRDKGDLQFVRTRTQIRDAGSKTAVALDSDEVRLQMLIWSTRVPTIHTFKIERAGQEN